MSPTEIEREVKFWVQDLATLEGRLRALGARLLQPRTHEYNLRFDTPDQALGRERRVLRLRRDRVVTLTYKGPGQGQEGIVARREINLQVHDFATARRFLEALGYRVVLEYEKYRAVYAWRGVQIMLDETPLGDFVEIEGPTPAAIREVAAALGLDWTRRMGHSYAALFARLQARLYPPPRHLTFAALRDHQPLPTDWLPVGPADAFPAP